MIIVSSQPFEFVVSCCAGGRLILLENCETPSSKKDVFKYKPLVTQQVNGRCNTVCDGIQLEDGTFILGCITAESEIFMYSTNQTGKYLYICKYCCYYKLTMTNLLLQARNWYSCKKFALIDHWRTIWHSMPLKMEILS